MQPEDRRPATPSGAAPPPSDLTVLHSRSLTDLDLLQADVVSADRRVADLFLRFVRETATLAFDEERLLSVVSEFTFHTFPQATHFALVTRDETTGDMSPLVARGRSGETPAVALSRTLVDKVVNEGLSLLYSESQSALQASESIRLSRINAAICAPLGNREDTFGVIQLDIRHPGRGTFGRKDVDRLALFAHYVALVLDNLRMHREQREALESTIEALMHSLSLKDPDTAAHSLRVKAVALHLGRGLGLTGPELDVLGVAAVLHDMGKHGIRDEVLHKSGHLTDFERREMARHAVLTENILDKIRYPVHLRSVPSVAAYHHEKLDGSGPYGLAGDQIPLAARILAVADVFDALTSARVYREPMTPAHALAILDRGRGREWDAAVVDRLHRDTTAILALLGREEPGAADGGRAAA